MDIQSNLRALKVFEVFSRTKNYSEAGKHLNVTHSAVSQQIRKLEAFLGCKLVTKTKGSIVLTEVGQDLADGLGLCFQQLNITIQETLDQSKKQTITVTMTPSFAAEWMTPRMTKFQKACPDLNLVISPSFNLIDIENKKIDLGVRFGDGRWNNLYSELWQKTPFVVATATKLLAGEKNLDGFDLASLPWLQELGTSEVEDWVKRNGYQRTRKPELIFMPGHMILPAMRDGGGIACTAKMLIQNDCDKGTVTILHLDQGDADNLGYYLVAPNKKIDPVVKRAINWFHEQ